MKQGKLIVIEGIDGSGKTTQIKLLSDYLTKKHIPHQLINFPRYGQNLYADLITRYLTGDFGSINEVNPYLIALAYAGDRALAKPVIDEYLKNGQVVIANRYVSSSQAHLGANLPEQKRSEFLKWVDQLEYQTNKMPKEDLTILLNVAAQIGQQNAGDTKDIHEANLVHLQKAAKIYLELSQQKGWVVLDSMAGGKMKDKSQIHKLIVENLVNSL